MRPALRRLAPYLAPVFSTWIIGLSYPHLGGLPLWWLAWVAYVPMLLSLRQRPRFGWWVLALWLGWFVANAIVSGYLANSSVWAWLGFAVQALTLTIGFALGGWVAHRWGWKTALLAFPFILPAWEWAYTQLEFAIPGLAMFYTQSEVAWMHQYASVSGGWGVSAWLMAFNCVLAWVWHNTADRPVGVRVVRLLIASAGCLLPVAASVAWLAMQPKFYDTVKVAAIQPNVFLPQQATQEDYLQITNHLATELNKAVGTHAPDLLVLPESSVPYDLSRDSAFFGTVLGAIDAWQTPLVTGFLAEKQRQMPSERAGFYNAAMVLTPEMADVWLAGKVRDASRFKVYYKQRLMPVGEMFPYESVFPWLGKSIRSGTPLVAGNQTVTFSFTDQRGGLQTVATPICYEFFFGQLLADMTRNGANFFALLTGDGGFDSPVAAHQLAVLAHWRAIEMRRSVVRCGNAGITEFTDPYGRAYGRMPAYSVQTAVQQVPVSRRMSTYARFPNAFPIACFAGLGLLLLFSLVKPKF